MKRRSIFIVESVYSPYFRIVLFLSLLVPLFGFNQNSDTLELEVINITPRYSKTLNHTNLRNADSIIVNAIPSLNLGQLLQYENSVQIK
ncbi:MAG: hypothetical protein ACK452_10210, partial [Bacteroidota bacterium]